MSPDKKEETVPYSGLNFIRDLEKEWGGQLYFAINPSLNKFLQNIEPKQDKAIESLRQVVATVNPDANSFPLTGNHSSDFKDLISLEMPHPEKATNFVHFLADPFCRGNLIETLEMYLKTCLSETSLKEGEFIIQDQSPIDFEDSRIFYETRELFPHFEEHIHQTRGKAAEISLRLNLTTEQRQEFVKDFELSLEEFENIYVQMVNNPPSYLQTLHPAIVGRCIMGLLTHMAKIEEYKAFFGLNENDG